MKKDWAKFLESMDEVMTGLKSADEAPPVEDMPVDNSSTVNVKEILDEVNQIFTPVLITQDIEQKVSDEANMELAEAGALNERSVVQLDDAGKMAQLVSTISLILARKKNTPQWQMFKKAAAIRTQSKIEIQKEEHDLAKEIAQKYLVMVSTSNNSAVARKAAEELLPQTQH